MIGFAKRRLGRAAGAVLFALAAIPANADAAPTAPRNVLRATLDNGLRVVIVRNALAPVVATAVNYMVGSDEAPVGFPGMAHAQEHMMFRGSPGLDADQLANIGSVMGGAFNANTRESITQYLYTVPAEDLDVALHIEALRMQDVTDSKEDWDKERGAIEQEVAQDLSSPSYVLYEKLRAQIFAGTPYAHAALGTRASFEATTADMLKRFYGDWYAPNNAILVVVGDVDPRRALASIKTSFGAIKSKTLPPRPQIKFAPVKPARIAMATDRPNASVLVAMRFPGLDSRDFPALEVLADVLGSRRFALYGLVPQGKALSAGFTLDPLPKASLAYAEVAVPANGDPEKAEADIRAILSDVAARGVPADLVAAAKRQERRASEFQKNDISDLAGVWSDALALYGLKSPQEDLRRIERVSVADVNRVARKYLKLASAVVAVTTPMASGLPTSSQGGFGGQESIALGEAKPTAMPDWATAALGRLEVPPMTLSPTVSTLSNGITLIVQPEDVSDTVSVYGHVRNRPDTEEPPGKEGVSQIMERLFSYGSESLDRLAFEKALDDIGASEDAGADFAVQSLSEDFDRAVALLADNELHPAFPQAAFEVARDQLSKYAAAREKAPAYLASRALRTALFPDGDPSLRDASEQSLRSVAREDVLAYEKSVLRPDMTTIVVIGKVSPKTAKSTIEKYFGSWRASGPKPNVDLPVAPPNRPGAIAVPDESRVQDSVALAQTLALNRANPDFYALELGDSVLAGGFYSARLSIDLRKNAGLVYSVGASFEVGRTRGAYLVQYASDPQNVEKAQGIVAGDIKTMQTTLVPEDELDRSKTMMLRKIPLGESSVEEIARGLLARSDLDLPLDEPWRAAERFIALTPEEVRAAFAKWLRPDDFVRVSQGPAPK